MSALRPSLEFKDKTNVNPSVNRQTEATAEDFEEAGSILDDHANRLDELQNELYHANFVGYFASEALLTSTYPTAPVDSFAIIIDGNNNPTAIFRYYNDTWNEVNATDLILYFTTSNDFPSPGLPKVWYIAKDTRISYLWYNNQYNIMNPGQQSNNFVTEKYIYPSQLDPEDGNLQQQMVAAINASPQFTIGEFDNMEYLLPVSTTPTDVIEVYIFKHKKGKGVYGTGGTQLTESNIQRGIRTRVRQDIVALGDIGTSTISAYINTDANGPYTEKAFTATINGTFKYYIYNGGAPLIGIGNTQTSEGDYQDMTTEEELDTSSFATLENLDETLPYEAKYYLTDIITNADPASAGNEEFLIVETDNAYYFGQKTTSEVDFLNCRLILRIGGFKYDFEATPDLTQLGYKYWQIALVANVDLTPSNGVAAFGKDRKFITDSGGGSTVDLVDALTSTATDKALTANQGRILKGFIDAINTLLSSDDTTLDELQEIVDYIKQNKDDLQNLSIGNIAGLQGALDNKLEKGAYVGNAEDLKTLIDNLTSNKADKYARVNISSSGNLLPVHNGKLLIITESVTLTYSGIYPDDFNFNIKVLSGGQLTIAKGDKILKDTEGNSVAQLVAEEHSFGTSYEVAAGEYMMEGNLS